MNKLLTVILGALMLSGCGDGNQQKLEACMNTAAHEHYFISPDGKRERLEAEERCVKLYK